MGDTSSNEKDIGFENINNDDSLDLILAEAKVQLRKGSGTGIASPQEVDAVIKAIIKNKKMELTQDSYNRVFLSCGHLLQEGATSPKYSGTRLISDYGVEFKVDDFRFALKTVGITARKFARAVKDQIIKIAKIHSIDGNLSKGFKLDFPDYDPEHLPWVSDFQTFSDNPDMPEQVRGWLLENYKSRFKPSKRNSLDQF